MHAISRNFCYNFYHFFCFINFRLLPVFGIGLWPTIAVLCFPVAAVKAGISAIHLYAASLNLAAIDEQERSHLHKQ